MSTWEDRISDEATVDFRDRLERAGRTRRKHTTTIPDAVTKWVFLEKCDPNLAREHGIDYEVRFYFLLVRCPYCDLLHGHSWSGDTRFITHRRSQCFDHLKRDGELFKAQRTGGYNVVIPKSLKVVISMTRELV